MQSMAEECFELTFSSKVCEATNTISDEPTPKLDSAIETMCRKTGEVMRQLVKHHVTCYMRYCRNEECCESPDETFQVALQIK